MKLAAMLSTRVHCDLAGDRGIALCGLARQLGDCLDVGGTGQPAEIAVGAPTQGLFGNRGLSLFLGLRASES